VTPIKYLQFFKGGQYLVTVEVEIILFHKDFFLLQVDEDISLIKKVKY
jgi:hypothetical protein